MSDTPTASPGKLVAVLGLFVLVGIPFVAFLWETLHQLLALHVQPLRLLLSAGVLVVFAGVLTLLGRWLSRQLLP